jgi:hypothetical protein
LFAVTAGKKGTLITKYEIEEKALYCIECDEEEVIAKAIKYEEGAVP